MRRRRRLNRSKCWRLRFTLGGFVLSIMASVLLKASERRRWSWILRRGGCRPNLVDSTLILTRGRRGIGRSWWTLI